ncbi:hypothetical protein FACS189459_6340 [Bacilli bacterium]|nr:hypothetical protein FACS189459_6340 [Bacilli bacterium]
MMGGIAFLDTKLINNKYSDNSFMLNAYLNPTKAKKDISFTQSCNIFYTCIFINNYQNDGIMEKFHIHEILKNLPSYTGTHLCVSNGQNALFANNFDDCLAMVDLQHKNYEIVTNDQSLIFEINEKTPEVLFLLKGHKPIFLNANAKKDLTIAKQIKKSIPKCKKIIDDNKLPTNIIEAFKYVESLYKSLKKGDIVAITNYAINTNIRGLKALFCLNNFSYLLCNDFLTKAILFVK